MTAYRSANEDAGPLVEQAVATAGKRDVMPWLAAPRVMLLRDLVAAIAKGHSFAEIAETSGVGRTYVEELAGLVRTHRGLTRKGKSGSCGAPAAVRAAREAGFSSAEIASATGKEVSGRVRPAKRLRRTGKGAFVVVGPPARTVGCMDESDVMLRGYCRSYAQAGHKVVLAGWRSRQPLDVLMDADRVLWGDPFDALNQVLSDTSVAAVYVDARNAGWESLASRATAAGATVVGKDHTLGKALAERKGLSGVLSKVGLLVKEGEEAANVEQARRMVSSYGYPVLVRDRGAAHEFVVAYDAEQLDEFLSKAPGPILVERFLEDLLETAVVVLADGKEARSVAVIEVLDEPGISSIDRAGVLPPFSITPKHRELLANRAQALVAALGGKGLVTVRLGMRYEVPYFLSATVGASREVPFAAMALKRDLVDASARIFMGQTLSRVWPQEAPDTGLVYIRQPVFSFGRFPGADTVLGTKPRSTGDVLGVGANFSLAYASARRATGRSLPLSGTVFLSLRDRDKRVGMLIGRQLVDLGFTVVATEGTARALASSGVEARTVHRVSEGRPNVVDLLKNREITMVIYTPTGHAPKEDEVEIRTVAWGLGIPVITAAGEALAALGAIEAMKTR
jgi:carbamoyl-phosphate synthase large subunit